MAKKLTKTDVKGLFADYDRFEDPKASRSAILQQIHDGYGPGPFTQKVSDDETVRFLIHKRKINGTNDMRYLLKVLDNVGEDTEL